MCDVESLTSCILPGTPQAHNAFLYGEVKFFLCKIVMSSSFTGSEIVGLSVQFTNVEDFWY